MFIPCFACLYVYKKRKRDDILAVEAITGYGMDSARSWFQKLQPRDKLRSSTRKKDPIGSSCAVVGAGGFGAGGGGEKEDMISQNDEEALSNITKQKVAAAKQYIENHYKEQMKNLQERKERCVMPV